MTTKTLHFEIRLLNGTETGCRDCPRDARYWLQRGDVSWYACPRHAQKAVQEVWVAIEERLREPVRVG